MNTHLMLAKVVQEPIWRLYSLCKYISMENVVGTSTGLSAFISIFSTVILTSKNVKNNDK